MNAYTLFKKYVYPFASITKNCQSTLRFAEDCWSEYADEDVNVGYSIAMAAIEQTLDPDFGGLPISNFASNYLSELKTLENGYFTEAYFQGHCDAFKGVDTLKNGTCIQYDSSKH